MSLGKCPKCEGWVSYAVGEGVEIRVPAGKTWKGISYLCPNCRTVISVQIDPIAIRADIINSVVDELKR